MAASSRLMISARLGLTADDKGLRLEARFNLPPVELDVWFSSHRSFTDCST